MTRAIQKITLNSIEAREITDQIKTGVDAVWHLVTRAYIECAWTALGYSSWDDYTTREFGTSRLRLPREERAEVVSSLRDAGLSIRAIAAATGIAPNTVQSDLAQVSQTDTPEQSVADKILDVLIDDDSDADNDYLMDECIKLSDEPEPVVPPKITGIDGKSYPVTAPKKEPRRKPITDQARDAGWNLRRAVERIERIAADDRFDAQMKKVAPEIRGHLVKAVEVCQQVLDRINNNQEER